MKLESVKNTSSPNLTKMQREPSMHKLDNHGCMYRTLQSMEKGSVSANKDAFQHGVSFAKY